MSTDALTDALSETLAVFADGTPLTTTDVADRLDLGRRSTYERLDRLVTRGHVETKKVGASARVWWRPATDTGRAHDADPTAASPVGAVLEGADVGVLVLDEALRVAWLNEAAERYFALDRERVLGRDKRRLIAERIAPAMAAPDRFADRVTATYEDNTFPERFECHVTAGDGRAERWLEHRSRPIEDGPYAGGRIELYHDITDRKRTQRPSAHDRAQFDALVTSVDEYAIFLLDAAGHVETWSPGAERLKGYAAEAIVGEHVSTFYTAADRDAGVPTANLDAAARNGSVEVEGWRRRADGSRFRAHVTITAIRDEAGRLDGYATILRDVSAQRERVRRLRRQRDETADELDEVFERVDDAVFALDTDWRFTYVNERAARLFGEAADSLRGRRIWETLDALELDGDTARERYEAAMASQTSATFECYAEQLGRWFESRLYPSPTGLSVYFRDVTDRHERRREREQYETIVETVDDGIYVLDGDDRFTMVNSGFLSMTGYDRETLLGSHAETVFGEQFVAIADEKQAELERTGEPVAALEETLYPADGAPITVESRFTPYEFADAATGRVGTVRDVSEHRARERELEDRVRQQEVVTDLGRDALVTRDVDAVMERAARELAATLETDFSKVLDLDDAAGELRLREGVGWEDGLVGTATVPASEAGSQANYTLAAGDPVVVEDLSTESRFDGPALLTEHGVRSGISTVVGPADSPWGVLGVHDRRPRHFSEHDIHFVQSVANILAAAIERHEIESALRRQREQLTALNSLNETIHETTASIIEQSSREAIEATVCDHLAASDSYCFAWTAEADPASETVRLRTEAGVEGYLDDVTLPVDPDDDEFGPTARAIRTGEIQTVRDCQRDAEYEPWHEQAAAHGFRSSAAIPISHEGTVYGALNVYAARPNAFDGHERAVIGQLGEIVGHAIAAIQRKRALMDDEVVQLEFHVDSPFDAFGVDASTDGTVRLDHAVPVGDERFLVYGRATPDAVETVETLVAATPHWESVRFREGSGAFELRLREPPVLSALASLGGTAERAVIEDGTFRLTLAVSSGVDVRDVVEVVQDTYPDAELRRQRQVSRRTERTDDGDGPQPDFTTRQRTALEVAYHAGFFEWPRAASGEAVADALDIAPSTFHQHLRKAERKLVAALFADGPVPAASAWRRDE